MILVVGPGRCGTSTVARILHENFKIPMGEEFTDSTHYEDKALSYANRKLVRGEIGLFLWHKFVSQEVLIRKEPWGFKCPLTSYTLPLFYAITSDIKLIRTKRPIQKVADSYARHHKKLAEEGKYREAGSNVESRMLSGDPENWKPEILLRERAIDQFINNNSIDHCIIDFSLFVPDQNIIDIIGSYINN